MDFLSLLINQRWILEFLTVAMLHALAVMSPGPDFAVVIKQSVSQGRRVGRITALGVGAGILIHISYSLLGIGLLIRNSEALFALMKLAAAAYLIYIGLNVIRAKAGQAMAIERTLAIDAGSPLSPALSEHKADFWPAFRVGFLTNGLNPKATLFFFSIFAVVISQKTPLLIQLGYGIYMALATAFWFFLVATLFGHQKVRLKFERMGHWFDRLMGLALIILGLKIALGEL